MLEAELSECRLDGTCFQEAEFDTYEEYTTKFGADDQCIVASDGDIAAGYSLASAGDTCANAFAGLRSGAYDAVVLAGVARSWHSVPFSSLDDYEQGLWSTLQLGSKYAAFSGTTWLAFAKDVLAHAPAWLLLSDQHKVAAAGLGFSAESWGLQWAIIERIFHNDNTLLAWGDFAGADLAAIESLGWDARNWSTAEPSNDADFLWGGLPKQKQEALAVLRVDEQLWNSAHESNRQVAGCFWHNGKFAAVGSKWVVGGKPRTIRGRRRRRSREVPGRARGQRSANQTFADRKSVV